MTISVAPATHSEAAQRLAAEVRDAAAHRVPLRIRGAGTWLDAGRPIEAAAELSVSELNQVLEYVPGDLTITVGAGITLGELRRITAEAGQWLALDPFGTDAGTIGATVSTASAGPLAHQFGLPRDAVLGMGFVTGDGSAVRAGGRVVKNVAGFDLVRLLTGAWGTLGVITELTLRLRARPEVDVTYAVPVLDSREAVAELRTWLAHLQFDVFAAELVSGDMVEHIGLGADGAVLLVRVGGREAAVSAASAVLTAIGDVREVPSSVWNALRAAEPTGSVVLRMSQLPSQIGDTWGAARTIAAHWPGTLAHSTVGRGVVRCILPRGGGNYDALRRALAACVGTRIFERLPARLWPTLAPSAIANRLSRGVNRAYDPHRILNPGILGGDA